jgi:rod shape-determining protein MreC
VFRAIQQYRTWLAVCGLIIFPLLVFRAHVNKDRDANFFDRGIFLLTSPVQELLTFSTDFISEAWYTYVDVVDARKDNIGLRLRLGQLQREVGRTEMAEDENHRLKELLEMKQSNPNAQTLSVRVIGHLNTTHQRGLRIARGLADGLRRGMAVVEPDGLVGRLQRVGFNSADVTFAIDEEFSVDVIAVRPRVRGRLFGRGNGEAMSFQATRESRVVDMIVGDRVVTSGLGGMFPPNLTLGCIEEIQIDEAKMSNIIIKPSVDFDTLRTVMVILNRTQAEVPWLTPAKVLPSELAPVPPPKASALQQDLATVTSTR